jgi:hypothetical protein
MTELLRIYQHFSKLHPDTPNKISGQLHGSPRQLQPQISHLHGHASTMTMQSPLTTLYRSAQAPQSGELSSPTSLQTQAQIAPTPSPSPSQTTLFSNEPYSRALGLATHASCNSPTRSFAPWDRTLSPHPHGTALRSNIDPPLTPPP